MLQSRGGRVEKPERFHRWASDETASGLGGGSHRGHSFTVVTSSRPMPHDSRMQASFIRLDPEVEIPTRSHIGDAAVDLQARYEVISGTGGEGLGPDRARRRHPRGPCRPGLAPQRACPAPRGRRRQRSRADRLGIPRRGVGAPHQPRIRKGELRQGRTDRPVGGGPGSRCGMGRGGEAGRDHEGVGWLRIDGARDAVWLEWRLS